MNIADIVVRDAQGTASTLGSLVDRPTVVLLPRYYG